MQSIKSFSLATQAFLLLLTFSASEAAINVPGADGTDGPLNITENTTINLSEAVTAAWDTDNSANAGKGVYDPEKWAVVFKYSSVNVAEGATLNFSNHASRAPVVWLVSGDVTIAGTVSLNGQRWQNAPRLSEPGPGGFRGGSGLFSAGVTEGAGFGPGGGYRGARGGRYATGVETYGNPSLVPIIGGSGGSGSLDGNGHSRHRGGGGGGGAILIATTGEFRLDGGIEANGGNGGEYQFDWLTGGGSGGGIRVVCDSLTGTGFLQARGGAGGQNYSASVGRVRIERAVNSNDITVVPDPSVIPLADGDTALLWPPSTAPEVKIVSIGGSDVPADPHASFGTSGPDVALPETNSTQIVIETTNVEQASQVIVRSTPRNSNNPALINAAVDTVVSTSPLVIRWTADVPVNIGYSAVQVRVVRP